MRSDYALYTVAVIFFILTAFVLAIQALEYREVWTVITVVLGLLFIGLGYSQRPKLEEAAFEQIPVAPTTVKETVKEESPVEVEVAPPSALGLTQLNGIGEKRSEQLKAAGINDVEDLAKASAKNLADKLNISPKIARRWIRNAKELTENS
jgi:predicted flap endonuclease-1-like 5' DNA nuclease